MARVLTLHSLHHGGLVLLGLNEGLHGNAKSCPAELVLHYDELVPLVLRQDIEDLLYDLSMPLLSANVKRTIILFVCLRVRAVHCEVAEKQSTEAFLNCLQRFKSRRPGLRRLWSDCGRNFVGAEKVINDAFRKWAAEGKGFLEKHGLVWHFGPPHAPTWGGDV